MCIAISLGNLTLTKNTFLHVCSLSGVFYTGKHPALGLARYPAGRSAPPRDFSAFGFLYFRKNI